MTVYDGEKEKTEKRFFEKFLESPGFLKKILNKPFYYRTRVFKKEQNCVIMSLLFHTGVVCKGVGTVKNLTTYSDL